MKISVNKTTVPKIPIADSELTFGTTFTDHMFIMDYDPENGWHSARIEPYGGFNFDPAVMVLHYGQSIFEGLKAYRTADDSIQLFRPQENFKRLNRSACAMCIPEIDEVFALEALKQLLEIEKKWVPHAPGTSLYIRPTIIATDAHLGVCASKTYRFFIILSPVGAYYKTGFKPVKIWVAEERVRAVRGGVGEAKTAANYAASLFASETANANGYGQVLWLDALEHKYVQEVGSMNIFFVIGDELITPALDGSILPGITRDSVMRYSKKLSITTAERKISIDEVIEASENGRLQEIFGTGTAAIISPVGELRYKDSVIHIGKGEVGPLTGRLYDDLQGIQYGRIDDPYGWIEPV